MLIYFTKIRLEIFVTNLLAMEAYCIVIFYLFEPVYSCTHLKWLLLRVFVYTRYLSYHQQQGTDEHHFEDD